VSAPLVEHRIDHGLAPRFAALAQHRTRSSLEGDPLYGELKEELESIARATEYRRLRPAVADRALVRVVAWNLERGSEVERAASFLASHSELSSADVLLLSEVDIGMARSGNRNVAEVLASRLGYDYVFGNSYVSFDGVRSGQVNELGLHGNAVLSRFPIRRFDNVSVYVTKDKFPSSEPRLGHKKSLVAEIEAPSGPMTVAVAHLDSHGSPRQRSAMLRDLLTSLDERGYPRSAIVGGDLNTSTYDVESLWRLACNVGGKLARGGFSHAIEHYMRPYARYEKEVFDVFSDFGFEWRSFNDLDAPTFRYEVGDGQSEGHVRGYLPGAFVALLRWKLAPWGGVAPLKIDWFAGRAVRALAAGELADMDGARASVAPFATPKPTVDGVRISDHDPIAVDVVGE